MKKEGQVPHELSKKYVNRELVSINLHLEVYNDYCNTSSMFTTRNPS